MLPLYVWLIFNGTFWKHQEREEMSRCTEATTAQYFPEF